MDRVAARQKSIAAILDSQAKARTATLVTLSTASAIALLGGGWYAYQKYTTPPTPKSAHKKKDGVSHEHFKELYYERQLAHFEETQTIAGLTKDAIWNGLGYAIATIATVTLLSSFNKISNVSLPAIRELLYPNTFDLCAIQEKLFKESFDYLQSALQDLSTEQSKIVTKEELNIFREWRGMLCIGLETSMATLVKSVEDFAALSIELATRAHNTLHQDSTILLEFRTLLDKIDRLVLAINGLSNLLETTMNASTLEILNHNRMQVGMYFRNTIVTAREALNHVVMLVQKI